jgi:hypothetical protein
VCLAGVEVEEREEPVELYAPRWMWVRMTTRTRLLPPTSWVMGRAESRSDMADVPSDSALHGASHRSAPAFFAKPLALHRNPAVGAGSLVVGIVGWQA